MPAQFRRNISRDQRKSSRISPDEQSVFKKFNWIVEKYRYRVLMKDRAAMRAFGRELKELGGREALEAGACTVIEHDDPEHESMLRDEWTRAKLWF